MAIYLTNAMKLRSWLYVILFLLIPTAVWAQEEAAGNAPFAWVDQGFSAIANSIFTVLFFDFNTGFPLIVAWLILGAIFFTIRLKFINLRAFLHGIQVIQGKYDDPNDPGEVSHFQALATALSATVGLGNIAGVAIAVSVGGPGAVLWMTVGGFFGMTSKFVECTLGQKYRTVKPDGTIAGGPMQYLSRGLGELGYGKFGRVLAILFSIFCLGGCLGGADMFQANQSFGAVSRVLTFLPNWVYGGLLVVLVGLVIIGGIQRIASVASTIVPAMCVLYVLVSLFVLLTNFTQIPTAFGEIFSQAFAPQAVGGGIIGTMVQGFRRSAFSNEAGIGSAAIAHSVAKTDEPVREGIVALLEPFIDTIVICNMTGLVIVITGAYNNPDFAGLRDGGAGAELTSAAFGTVVSWFPILIAISVFFFAFSTMISWSYYGERAWDYLFGENTLIVYKILFLGCAFIGAVTNPAAVIDFSDAMFLSMAFPNMLGLYFLSNNVAGDLNHYLSRLKSGEMTQS